MVTFAAGTYFLLSFEKLPAEDIVFEAASALGTVGLSRGITPELTAAGKMVIMCMMYIGRLGVLSLALGAVALYHDITKDDTKDDTDTPLPAKNSDIVL
jgi:trk system potassium uptake protein TrkH